MPQAKHIPLQQTSPEYLCKKGVPFRQAHEITGKIVRYCIKNKNSLKKFLSPNSGIFLLLFQKTSARASRKFRECKDSRGGTSPSEVRKQIKRLKQLIK